LPFEELRGRHCAGVHVLFFNFDAHAGQFRDDVAPGSLTVVSEKTKWNIALAQLADKPVCAADHL